MLRPLFKITYYTYIITVTIYFACTFCSHTYSMNNIKYKHLVSYTNGDCFCLITYLNPFFIREFLIQIAFALDLSFYLP